MSKDGFLPPGVEEYMIPGNRPEDREIEVALVLAVGDIDDMRRFKEEQDKLPQAERNHLWCAIENILEQLEDIPEPPKGEK